MNEDQRRGIIVALRNAEWAINTDKPMAAESWAWNAAEQLREANVSSQEQRALVAPNDGFSVGDKVCFAVSLMILAVLLIDCTGVWK